MKRFFSILFFLSIFFSGMAQHMKFMGLPIDGTIDQFGKQLTSKGFSKSASDSKTGYWSYNGYFNEKKVQLGVQYNAPTNKVFSVQVTYLCSDSMDGLFTYEEWKKKLEAKYDNQFKSYDDSDRPAESMFRHCWENPVYGLIMLDLDREVVYSKAIYFLHLTYTDMQGYANHINNPSDDF